MTPAERHAATKLKYMWRCRDDPAQLIGTACTSINPHHDEYRCRWVLQDVSHPTRKVNG